MADLPTRQELFRRFRSGALGVPNSRISAREIDREGSDANLLAACASIMGEEIVRRCAKALAGCFEDTARREQLDRVVFDRKGLPRLPAEVSVGEISVQRPTAAAGAGTIQGGLPGSGPPNPTRIRTNRGIVYTLDQSISFGAADLGPFTAPIRAQLAGLDYEVAENQTWSWVDPPFDTTIVISNPEETAGAANEEEDSRYRARAKAFWPTVRRGTLPSIEFGLLNTPGIDVVSVLEVIDSESSYPARVVQAFILDALGLANDNLAARGLLNLLEYRGAGIPVVPIPGTPTFVDIRILPSFDTGIILDTSQAAEDMKSAIIAALNNQIPGQELSRVTILSAATSVEGVLVEEEDLIEPAGTLVPPTPDVTYRTRRELIETI